MTPDDRIAALERIVMGAVGLTTQALAEAAPGTELTFQQWRALLIIGEDPAGARVGQVARRVGVTLPATSRLLRRLERRGLVELAVDDQDRRATRGQLSAGGEAVRSAILAYRRAALGEIADRMAAVHPAGPDAAGPDAAIDALAAQLGSFA